MCNSGAHGMGMTNYSLITCKVHLTDRNMSSTINDWGLTGPKGAPPTIIFINGHGIKLPLNLYFCSHGLMYLSDLIQGASLCIEGQLTQKFTTGYSVEK